MSDVPTIGRVRGAGIAICIALFASGALAGAAIEHVRLVSRLADSSQRAERVVPPDEVITNMKMAGTGVPVVYEALGLTVQQRDQIRNIIDASRPRTDSLLRDTWPPLRAIIDSVRRRVEEVLTADQRAQLAALRRGARRQ